MADDGTYDDGVLRIVSTTSPDGLVLAGEIDESTYPALVTALDRLTIANGTGRLHIDLSGVEFCDAAGLHAMVRLAARAGCGGRAVVLHAPPAALRAMLRIVGWEDLPGLVVEDR